jgi:hypothetical protein
VQRTRRQASLIQQVQIAISRLDESRLKAKTTLDHPDRHDDRDAAVDGRRVVAGGLSDDATAPAQDPGGVHRRVLHVC